MSLRQSVKHGIGRLTASASSNRGGVNSNNFITRLTQVSHKYPTRLVPLGKTSVEKAGAAVCALSNYGGGMLQGDSCDLTVNVEANARLGIITQGASRIYTQRRQKNECRANLSATVHKNGLLVLAPDPCALFESSSFRQTQTFRIHPKSSVVLIDWFSSGRYRNGEHWAFDKLSSSTRLEWLGTPEQPFLQDFISMDLTTMATNKQEDDPLGVSNFHAFASLLLYGKDAEAVEQRCFGLQDMLVAKHTRIRERRGGEQGTITTFNDINELDDLGLAGRVCMGMSRVSLDYNGKNQDAHVVRIAATNNEDVYRVFHYCLSPLKELFGMEFYKERIRAKASEIPRVPSTVSVVQGVHSHNRTNSKNPMMPTPSPSSGNDDDFAFWSAYMLADSSMPTGSFAHSAGVEAAMQLGMLQNEKEVQTFIQAATRSSMQVLTPFLLAGHRLARNHKNNKSIVDKWKFLDRQAQAVLASNAPACAASLDQGKALARVAQQWIGTGDNEVTTWFENGNHVGPVLGAVAAELGLNETQACRIFGYCVARDMVSAAVRLSLVGPLASIPMLQKVRGAAEGGWRTSWAAMMEQEDPYDALSAAATCAPVVEALHPCHDVLQLRLFRT